MSAGERQLVALVRAYLSPAPLVVIAHRISSALRADRILVLDGASATVGDHNTLLRVSPLYRDLLGHWEAGRTPTSQPA